MPELPEVETVRRTLEPLLVGRTITAIDVRWPNIIHGDVATFTAQLCQQTCSGISRYGKYLLFEFGELVLVSHLRMEGKFYYQPIAEAYDKHVHVLFTLDNGMQLRYHDVRKFGTMAIVPKATLWAFPALKKLGYEPFSPEATTAYLAAKLARTRRPIKAVLLDQTILVGLGNIYVDEVLFLAKIHPEKPANQLSEAQVAAVLACSQAVLTKAIELGGTTIRTYQSTLGVDGRFQNELHVHTKKGEPCPVCGTTIVKQSVGGRGTYYCPRCQTKE